MKVSLLIGLIISTFLFSVCAQDPVFKTYTWEANPKLHDVSKDPKNYPAIFILHNRFLELRIDETPQSYFTEHKIIHINNAAGIEKFNKVYIPLRADQKLVSLNVRAVDPDGRITLLKKENLKELKNVEGYGNFKIFAVEGLTVGGEMEYLYTTRSNPQSYGRYMIQSEIPVKATSVIVLYPPKFKFIARSYNGLPQPEIGTFNTHLGMIELTAIDIPALADEQYSAHRASLMHIDFKLDNDIPVNTLDWDGLSERILKSSFDPGGYNKVKRMIKSLSLDKLNELQKIQAVEKIIKTDFTVKEDGPEEYEDIKTILEKHVANERGILKLYLSCWEALGLEPQLVIATNRFTGKIDPQFALPSDITDLLFYFPKLNYYLTPTVPYLRLGAAPDYLASGKAIFIDYHFSDKGISYSRHHAKTIEPLSYEHNHLGIRAKVTFNNALSLPQISQETFWQGYRASSYRGIYRLMPETKKEEFLKNVTLLGMEDATIIKRDLEGEDINLSSDPDSYFKIKTIYTSPVVIEQAGGDYLLAVGKLIGTQSELYQEKERQTDIEFTSIANYNHEIIVEIPEGYSCSGLDAIKIHNVVNDKTEDLMKFDSDYTLNGNTLTIKINEVYKVLKLTKENYESFRKVVNSAADFNKVVLVLSPK